ncbi:MAG: PHP domain-containing protein [Peptostreptococcaceae bacterium]
MIKADLHVHTDISDCSLSTEEVIKLAKKNGVTHIAITNHDTVKGLKEAISLGEKYGVCVIPGIEISAYDYKRDRKVHLLGYGIDLEGKHIKNLCKRLLTERNEMTLKQTNIIKSLGYDICIEDVKEYGLNSGVAYKQHIMQVLIDKGYIDQIYSPLYKNLFKNNGPCQMEVEYIDINDAIEAIIQDNGIPVLAHPGQLKSYELLEELAEKGLIGVEKYHISHNEEDYKKIDELAKKYSLVITGGSDFHGTYGKDVTVGSYTSPVESVEFILSKIR